ncbi:MAG: ribosome maturation factor RimP [Myxococcaceae bacterium]|nr:ribosome maturation factor RimP [Myxococcaceae bacterium]
MGTSWLLMVGSYTRIRFMPKQLVDVAKLESLIAPICQAQGVELVDARYQREPEGAVVRVLIEQPGAEKLPPGSGVTLDDCRRVSRALSDLLDADELVIPGQYRLEVSSAGVERPLTKAIDFDRYSGREIQLSTKTAVEGRKTFSGTLGGLRGDQVLLRDSKGEDLALPLDEVAKAHLIFRF